MKRVLMLLESPFPTDVRVENEMKALTGAGYEVHLACYRRPGEEAVAKLPFGTVHRTSIPKWVYKSSVGALKFPLYFAWWRRQAEALLEQLPFDVVHVHDLPLARVGQQVSRRHGCRFVLDLHEIWPALLQVSAHTHTLAGRLLSSDRQWRAYERRMAACADRVVVVVEESAQRLASLGIPAEKITVVSNTLNVDTFDVNDTLPDAPSAGTPVRMLYVGGMTVHRGLQDVLRAMALLKDGPLSFSFDLVGDGSYLPELRRLAESLQIAGQVHFHGFRRFTEIAGLYRQAQLAVIPHRKSEHTDHTIPHKLFQYMYSRTPMLVSSCDPLVRIVSETHSGLSYTSGDPADLSRRLVEICRPEVWRACTLHGRDAVTEKYNWAHDGQHLTRMYASLTGAAAC